jgi:CofH subfamily radical SAM domain protein
MNIHDVENNVRSGKRITREEAHILLQEENWPILQTLANEKRIKEVGDEVFYAVTLFLYPTNLCELNCPFCSYYAKPGWKNAWFMTPAEIEEKVKANLHYGLNEVHIVGGLWHECDLGYYKETFERIKSLDSDIHIKALTAVEYDYLARLHGISVEEVLDRMVSYGLGSIPGGGAEVFVDSLREKLAPGKIDSDTFLNIHRIAHKKGLSTNITLLYGSIEEWDDIITHFEKVRNLQDETGGFTTFIPLKYHDENNALGKRKQRLKPKDARPLYALARIFLDNIPILKALWNYQGVPLALELLDWGVNDFASTALDEKVITMAGGVQIKMDGPTMENLILSKGRKPQKVHSGFRMACN